MSNITYYRLSGEIVKEVSISKASLCECHGMKVKCALIDGSERVGYANVYWSFEKCGISLDMQDRDYITLETFVNLDEETHTFFGEASHKYDVKREAISISLIAHMDAILHSGLRWGGVPTNKFNLKNKQI